MFVDQKHLLRQSPPLTLLSLMTSLQSQANFGICASGRIVSADFAIITVSTLIVTSSQIYFCLYHIHKTGINTDSKCRYEDFLKNSEKTAHVCEPSMGNSSC